LEKVETSSNRPWDDGLSFRALLDRSAMLTDFFIVYN
jgi:hypothetical protein